jgi:hypothetical protein
VQQRWSRGRQCWLFVGLDRGAAEDQDAGALDFKYKLNAGSGLDVTSELTYHNATFIYGWTAQTVMA